MPGLFGGIGKSKEMETALKDSFESIWGNCETFNTEDCFLGSHAFPGFSALHTTTDGLHFAVDGELSLYKNAALYAKTGTPKIFSVSEDNVRPCVDCKGNVAIFNIEKRILYIITEWTGTFPLYYSNTGETVFFSSHLRPLARAIGAQPDPVGMIQFLRYSYILANRTQFKGIKRLMPGQAIVYELDRKRLRIVETSRAWTDVLGEEDFDSAIDRFWVSLKDAVKRCTLNEDKLALMSSAGWDSRLIFAALRDQIDSKQLLGYSHGDIESRELDITKQIYKDSKINCHLEPVNNHLYDPQSLKKGFERVENVIYPHWHRAGSRFREMGIGGVTSGLLGELVGGHYGFDFCVGNREKMFLVLSNFLRKYGLRKENKNKDLSIVYDFLRNDEFEKPWYVDSDFWMSIPDIKENINADVEYTLSSLQRRGVNTPEQLIEAYLTGYRGSRYGTSQMLSCRSNLNIFHIFADQELYLLASQISFPFKAYNAFNQAVLRRYAPDLLKYPTAAILASASSPLIMQEITRLIRKISEHTRLKVQSFTKGTVKPKHLGWDNFEFLRDGKVLNQIVDDVNCNVLNIKALNKFISNIQQYGSKVPLYHVSDQFMKIYTTDLMMR